jgi:hypothetical protein
MPRRRIAAVVPHREEFGYETYLLAAFLAFLPTICNLAAAADHDQFSEKD